MMAARNININGMVLGNDVPINISIENNFRSTIDFTLFGFTYTFTIEKWAGRGFNTFFQHFHAVPGRDVSQFGVMTEDASGAKLFFENHTGLTVNVDGSYTAAGPARALTMAQKLNAIERACGDVITCLNKIGAGHQRSMLEYCIWYREHHLVPVDYSQYITLVTAHNVVHTEFMAPNVNWAVVQF